MGEETDPSLVKHRVKHGARRWAGSRMRRVHGPRSLRR